METRCVEFSMPWCADDPASDRRASVLATGYTDMRRGFPSLALQVQEVLRKDPLSGHLFVFRGRRSDLVKMIWHDGQGCLFTNYVHSYYSSFSFS
jgi:transposase